MKTYELIFVARPDIADAELSKLAEKISSLVTEKKGTVVKLDKWGRQRLAYAVEKFSEGIFYFMEFAGNYEIVREIERNLRMSDSVLRYLIVGKIEDKRKKQPEKAPVKEEPEKGTDNAELK